MPAGAIIGGSLIGAATSIYGSNQAAGAARSAARQASNAELQMYNQSRADLAPYREAGYGALDMINQLYGVQPRPGATTSGAAGTLGMPFEGGRRRGAGPLAAPGGAPAAAGPRDLSSFYTSPNYQFVRDEGIRGLTNSASARGGQLSGNALRGTTEFSSNLASGEFNNYVSRLFGIAGLGGSATSQGVQAGQQTGNTLANIYTNAGNARGSAYMAGAQGVNSAVQGGLQNWAFNNYLNSGSGGSYGRGS